MIVTVLLCINVPKYVHVPKVHKNTKKHIYVSTCKDLRLKMSQKCYQKNLRKKQLSRKVVIQIGEKHLFNRRKR